MAESWVNTELDSGWGVNSKRVVLATRPQKGRARSYEEEDGERDYIENGPSGLWLHPLLYHEGDLV